MKDIDVIIQKIVELDRNISNFDNCYPPVDINNPDWMEEAEKQSIETFSKFANEINDLNDELTLHWRQYNRQDILQLQNTLKETSSALRFIGIRTSELNPNNLTNAFFLLLLISKHWDYRDCLIELNDLINFAVENGIDYENISKEISILFDDYEFHIHFKKIIEASLTRKRTKSE